MYGNGYSMAIVLDHRSTATSLTGNHTLRLAQTVTNIKHIIHENIMHLLQEMGRKVIESL